MGSGAVAESDPVFVVMTLPSFLPRTPALAVGLLLGLLVRCVGAHAATLVPTASTWGWRPGTNEASAPLEAWRARDFDGRGFTPARAPFWYGDVLPGGTEITGMRGVYGCVFLRVPFTVGAESVYTALRLQALVDDGFVAWINGTEVLRVRVPGDPGSPVTVSTLADNAPEPVSMTTYDLPPPAGYLVPGANVLAVQVFQSSLTSSDLGFEASLEGVLADAVAPRVIGWDPLPGSTVDAFDRLVVRFSEPVRGVVAAHLRVQGIGATAVTAVDAATYQFTFSPPPYGTVSVTWDPAHTVTDLAEPANRLDASEPEANPEYARVDGTAPAVLGISPAPGATVRSLESVTVLFAEPVRGVDAADLRVGGRAATDVVAVAATEYRFAVDGAVPGVVEVSWAANHGITDQASPPNAFSGGGWTYRLDPDAVEAPPYISEFMASNTRTLKDDTGQYSDWIEIHNPGGAPVDLGGWYLTDTTNNLTRWRFPAVSVPAGGFLVVFASGADRRDPAAPLHTDFQLSASGEFLALVRPEGVPVPGAFEPAYPVQVPDVSYGVAQVPAGQGWEAGPFGVYFLQPTPGTPNPGGSAAPGPAVEQVGHRPNVPRDDQDLEVTARVRATFRPVAGVNLRYRVLFGAEVEVPMADDGLHGDGGAGDGVYGAVIPAAAAGPGEMIRYRVVATDLTGASSRWPLFTRADATPEYLGTIVEPANLSSPLPIFHLFVAPNQLAGIDRESGGRISVFHDGEFYDNVYMELRGNTSAGLNKKSHRLEFNRGQELRHSGAPVRTRKSSLLAEYLDPTYLRQHLCFWLLDRLGVPSPFHYPVRVQLNGQFYQLAFHNDVIGQEQMERMGYDPRGALYKAVGNLVPSFSSTGVFQKLEPDGDPTRTDYLQLANGIHESSALAVRRATVFDLLDLPEVVNHLAGARWCAENDDVWANMSLYRDTFGDGLWRLIPFDMNASWGQLYGGSNPLEATVDNSKSHPLYGGSNTEGNFNRLYDVIIRLPETREMLLRRERSLLDLLVQPPGTPMEDRILENHVRQMTNLIAAEAALDRARWGSSPWAPGKSFASGVGDLLTQFIDPRRRHWYVTHSITNTAKPIGISRTSNAGIPLEQPADATPTFLDVEFNPASGNQAQEYFTLTNAHDIALDLSGWKVDGAVNFTFRPGTVLPSHSVLFVSPEVRQFRSRAVGPRGGQGLFVVGPYSGQLSARGETLVLRRPEGRVMTTNAYVGNPSPAQQWLRVTEIHYHPAPLAGHPSPADDFEFLELQNLSNTQTLDLRGVRFAEGVVFQFTGSAVTSLVPQARVLVVANPAAFSARYGEGLPVAGTYTGRLDNSGERLRLLDASGEEILDFSYNDSWRPATDGLGSSLQWVGVPGTAESWGDRASWRASAAPGGSPGTGDTAVPPAGAPLLVVQPVGGEALAGGPVALSLAVTNTALLPLGVQVWRGTDGGILEPWKSFSSETQQVFFTVEGEDAGPPWTRFRFRVSNTASPAGLESDVAVLTWLVDSDADGLPDDWERTWAGGLAADPRTDADGDGHDLRSEWLAGTNPSDAGSVLQLRVVAAWPAVRLAFRSEPGRTYSVQYRDGLVSPGWKSLLDVPAGAVARERQIEDRVAGSASWRWYRVVTPRTP